MNSPDEAGSPPAIWKAMAEEAESRARYVRVLTAGLLIVLVLVVAISAVSLFVSLSFNDRAAQTHRTTEKTLQIAQSVTDPKAQSQQFHTFYANETAIFRQDCDAKAHQFAIADFLAGRSSSPTATLDHYQPSCSEIQAPPLP